MVTRRKMIGKKRQFFSENKYPKVLIAAPIYEHKYYCIQDYIDNLKELTYPNADILLVDNSKDENAHKIISDFNPDIEVIYSSFSGNTRSSQCDAYNVILDRVLNNAYDYLMVIESDLIPHETIIEDLMSNDKDICGATYQIYGKRKEGLGNGIMCVTTGKFVMDGHIFRETFMKFDELNGELKKIQGGIGLGCCLIKRKVLESLKEEVNGFRWHKCHADTYFHRDAHRLGFETWLDTRFIIPHYPSDYPDYF